VPEADAPGGREHIWKIVRTFDDPATWTEPLVRQVTGAGKGGESFRTEPLSDEWELYDLDQDPFESVNLARVPGLAPVLAHLTARLNEERTRSVPPRHHPWPYAARSPRPLDAHRSPLALLRNGLKWLRRVRHIP